MFRIFKQVQKVAFGVGCFSKLEEVIAPYRKDGYVVFLVDDVHNKTGFKATIPLGATDKMYDVDVTKEPKVVQVDKLRDMIQAENKTLPNLVVGVGGGSTLDIAKAVSVMLKNEGSASLYQGWDLVKTPAVPKLGIPTLSGTGSEASRTTVLSSDDKKYGINSDYSMFDIVLLDPELIKNVPNEQRFYTGMDCHIHCIESLEGSFINSFGKVYAKSALELCKKVFLNQGGTDEDLMVASYMGGASVANSEVGVVHAMSYGLSLVLGYRHGIANCIAFNQLEEFYPAYVPEFREMMKLNNIQLPTGVTSKCDEAMYEKMIQMTLRMERPLTSALGDNWKDILTPTKIRSLYERM